MEGNFDILAMAAHPDDIELGAAGTLVKHLRKGQSVAIVDLTRGELGTRGTPELRSIEAENAARVMGVQHRENAGLPDGFFENREESLRILIRFIRRFRPRIVIANALEDRHPDHGRGGRLIADACFLAGLAKIETQDLGKNQLAWRPKRVFHMIQDRFLEPDFIVDISDTFESKMEAIAQFKSQFHDPDSNEPQTYISSEKFMAFIQHRAADLGKRIGKKYGEGFLCENTPAIADLDQLLYPEFP